MGDVMGCHVLTDLKMSATMTTRAMVTTAAQAPRPSATVTSDAETPLISADCTCASCSAAFTSLARAVRKQGVNTGRQFTVGVTFRAL